MTNNELLISISDLIDKKLKPVDDRTKEMYPMLESIKQNQVRMDNDIRQNHASLKSEIKQVETSLKDEISQVQTGLKSEISQVQTGLKNEIKQVQTGLKNEIKQVHTSLKNEINQVKTGLKSVQITLESEIKPRLDNIESCYLATYRRYMMGAEEMDALKADMGVVKNVLSEHSEKIKELSQSRKSIGG